MSVVKQHRMMVCRMTMEARKRKRMKAKPKIKWWKLRKEECCEQFREEVKQALSCCEKEMHNWATVTGVVRKTARKVLGVSLGQKKEGRDTWWWNEEVQKCTRAEIGQKELGYQRNEENRQEYKDMCRIVQLLWGEPFDSWISHRKTCWKVEQLATFVQVFYKCRRCHAPEQSFPKTFFNAEPFLVQKLSGEFQILIILYGHNINIQG